MLKQISVLITLIALASFSVSCQTMEFGDVVPEAKGSAIGDIKIGKPNRDFFVIPGAPITPAQMRGDVPVPPQNIVVFKTREQQPLYKAARIAAIPARGVTRVCTMVVDAITRIAFGWLGGKKKKEAVQATPLVYPASFTPTTASAEPFANARSLGAPVGPAASAAAQYQPTPHPIRNGG
jgi:hypothetical protein